MQVQFTWEDIYIHVIGDVYFFLVWVLWDTQTDKENASILPMLWLNLFEIMDIMLNFITSVSFLMCNTYNTFVYIHFVWFELKFLCIILQDDMWQMYRWDGVCVCVSEWVSERERASSGQCILLQLDVFTFSFPSRLFFSDNQEGHKLLVVQCDCGDLNQNLIKCAQYCMQDLRPEDSTQHHVVFIVQLPRVAGACFTGFLVRWLADGFVL